VKEVLTNSQAQPSAPPTHPVLPVAANDVTLSRDGRCLLDQVSLSFDSGPLSVIMGPNGAGKSLALRVLARLVKPDSGGVTWAGVPPSASRALGVGMVFQKPVMLRRTVLANLEFALAADGVPRADRKNQASALLERAGMAELGGATAKVLSGGEQQKLALVRALATAPQILLLDEPTASLDPGATADFESLLHHVHASGTKVVLVTHDIGQAHRLADEVAFFHRGKVAEHSDAATFFSNPQHEATQAFLDGRLFV
jgi:tungstate transport system ATP-binding protein